MSIDRQISYIHPSCVVVFTKVPDIAIHCMPAPSLLFTRPSEIMDGVNSQPGPRKKTRRQNQGYAHQFTRTHRFPLISLSENP